MRARVALENRAQVVLLEEESDADAASARSEDRRGDRLGVEFLHGNVELGPSAADEIDDHGLQIVCGAEPRRADVGDLRAEAAP